VTTARRFSREHDFRRRLDRSEKVRRCCEASRNMKDAEKKQLLENGAVATEIPVAKEGLSVYVNSNNPIKDLIMAQLKDIFTGKETTRKMVGGGD
jgi:phosphate transport system substrate-binding protein